MCDVQIFRPHFHIGRAIFNVSSLFHPSNFGELTPVRKTSEMITRTLYSDTIIVVLGKQKGKQKKNYDFWERTSTCFRAVCARSMLSDSINEIPTMLKEYKTMKIIQFL